MAWWYTPWWPGRGWGGGWRWWSPWPGRGPFSFLPPWLRPGWLFGRGACRFLFPWMWWYWYYTPWTLYYLYYPIAMTMYYLPVLYYLPPLPRWW